MVVIKWMEVQRAKTNSNSMIIVALFIIKHISSSKGVNDILIHFNALIYFNLSQIGPEHSVIFPHFISHRQQSCCCYDGQPSLLLPIVAAAYKPSYVMM